MKRNKMIRRFITVCILLAIAFVIGFQTPDLYGFGISGNDTSFATLPQRILKIGRPLNPSDDESFLPLIATFSEVMGTLMRYYNGKFDQQEVAYNAIRGALGSLNDPYTRFIDPEAFKTMREENEGNFTGIGALLATNDSGEVYIKEPLPETPAIKAGLKAGDIILAVDDKNIAHMDIDEVVKLIRGEENTTVKLKIRRDDKTFVVPIVRKIVQTQTVKSNMVDEKNKIGYIRLYQFNEQAEARFAEAFSVLEKQKMKALVFDLRGNPGGLLEMALELGSEFVESGTIVIIQDRGGNKTSLGVRAGRKSACKYHVAVLIDGSSASASEIVSGAIKDTKSGTLVGKTTFGKGLVQTLIPMLDGSATAITTSKYLTPNGTDINKKGIAPDIEVELNEDYDPDNPEKDTQLQAALDVLKVDLGVEPKSILDKYKTKKETKNEEKK